MKKLAKILMAAAVLLANSAEAQNFTYFPPGFLEPRSGPNLTANGLADYTVHASNIRFPIEEYPAYAHSQCYNPGGTPTNNDPRIPGSYTDNYHYPWQDDFCEYRGNNGTWSCPGHNGHQGQDIRPKSEALKTYFAVAATDGTIDLIKGNAVELLGKNGIYYEYLHMDIVGSNGTKMISVGQKVTVGQKLGYISDHYNTSLHLHFGIVKKATPQEQQKPDFSSDWIDDNGYVYVSPYLSLVRAYERLIGETGKELQLKSCTGPGLILPTKGGQDVKRETFFSWFAVACGNTAADVYRIQVHTSSSFPPECDGDQSACSGLIAMNEGIGNGGTRYTAPAGKLAYATTYYWRVRGGHTAGVGGSWSDVWNFTTERHLFACLPSPEVCDGIDNDCDGQIDEGCNRGCANGSSQSCYDGIIKTETVGICRPGTQTCVNGNWGVCTGQVLPSTEVCNNKDDDCDGQTDENLTRSCGNACNSGVETCIAGVWKNCTAAPCPNCVPSPEICNNKDDDCDGSTDENLVRDCWWICGPGKETCVNGNWINCTAPSPNSCGTCENTRACQTACGTGTETCWNGSWVSCTARLPTPETCNNTDDDCNGLVDDGLWIGCNGACGGGTQKCANGNWTTCNAQGTNSCGVCNDTRACQTACGTGTETCRNGGWVNCTAAPCPVCTPSAEICDGKDNNCNGQIDENLVHDCWWVCGPGTETCVNGSFRNCTAPSPNSCGTCENTRTCQTAYGTGIETCSNGQWVNCTAPPVGHKDMCDEYPADRDWDGVCDVADNCPDKYNPSQSDIDNDGLGDACDCVPVAEFCNNKDDDCNGLVDDGLWISCGVCGGGTRKCVNGNWMVCNDPGTNSCGSCSNTRTCYIAGEAGIETCSNGQWVNCTVTPVGPEDPCAWKPDDDWDGVCNMIDNCPDKYNPLQQDADSDGHGDACDCWGCASNFV